MSSLTDIIFLLLIFFMLTSSTIQINFDLPESDSRTVAPTTVAVTLRADGSFQFNGKASEKSELNGYIRKAYDEMEEKDRKDATLAIVTEVGVPWKDVYEVMGMANSNRMRAIIATQPKN